MSSERRPDLVSFSADEEGTVHARDEVDGGTLELSTAQQVDLQPALPALFHFPVDNAVSFETDELVVGSHSAVYLRGTSGDAVGEFGEGTRSVPLGTYYLDVTADLKVYVRAEDAAFEAHYDGNPSVNDLAVSFDAPTTVTIGARSLHTRPAHEITVPDDPTALIRALSYAGCGLKELSSERSWPTLRGHPPAFRPGDELVVPSTLTKPDTGLTLTVPPDYDDIYRVAPLAYYLGATVEPGDDATLVLDNGYTHELRTQRQSLDAGVEGVLARALLLDTLTRHDGYYALPQHEYDEIAPHLPFYPENLYEASISDALFEYLEVEDDVVRKFGLTWPMVGVVPPAHDAIPVLSSLLHALVPIHVRSSVPEPDELLFEATSMAYATRNESVGSARVTARAFENGRNRTLTNRGRIGVVSEDTATAAAIRENARSDSWLHPDRFLQVATSLPAETPDCLVLDLPAGHPYRRDARTRLPSTPRTFVVRTDDGLAESLVEDGAVGGIVLHDDPTATELTTLLALLDVALPLGATADALSIPTTVVGDPRTPVVLQENGAPASQVRVTSRNSDEHAVDFQVFGGGRAALGAVGRSDLDPLPDTYHVVNCTSHLDGTFDTDELLTILNDEYEFCELNGDLVVGTHPVTEADVERSVRQNPPDARTAAEDVDAWR